jgi:hypothetical protein
MKKLLLSLLFFTIASIQLLAGDGSAENPYTVSEARALAKSTTKIWVQGTLLVAVTTTLNNPGIMTTPYRLPTIR